MIKKMTTFVLAMMAAQTLSASPGASTRHRRNIVAQVQEKVRKRECNSSFACASPPALVASAEKFLLWQAAKPSDRL